MALIGMGVGSEEGEGGILQGGGKHPRRPAVSFQSIQSSGQTHGLRSRGRGGHEARAHPVEGRPSRCGR